jgi:hypothetical protein
MTDAVLRLVTPDALRADWLAARPHIEALRQRQGSTWLVEDVYHLLRSNVAMLWVRDPLAAFFVTLQQIDPFAGTRVLTVWIGWNSTNTEALREDMDALRQVAALQGCEAVRFVSARKGWQRHAGDIGFMFHEATYEAPAMTQEMQDG